MIFEVVLARGTRLWVDGRPPKTQGEWVVGDLDNGRGQETNTADNNPLPFDAFNLNRFEFDIPINEYSQGDREPQIVTLTTDRGIVKLPVVAVQIADINVDEAVNTVKLVNGESLELDETMLYVRAEG